MRPPEELCAGALVIRRYRPADARALHAAVTESVEHLRPWMAWIADEPLSVADREERIGALFDAGWAGDRDFVYGLFDGDAVVGGCGLHRRIAEGGLEIGYWVRAGHTGRGLATVAAGALADAALALDDVTHVEIHHDRANVASGRVAEKLGFTFVEDVPQDVVAPGETGVNRRWRLDGGA